MPSSTVFYLVGIILFIIAVVATAQCAHHVKLHREHLAMKAASARLQAQINSLKKMRYCADQQECECCRQHVRDQDCTTCLIVKRACRQPSGCRDDGCPDHGSSECAICLQNFLDGDTLRLLPCHHIFHSECADKWLAKSEVPDDDRKCPMCRAVAIRVRGRESSHRRLWRARVRAEEPMAHV